MTTPEHDLKSSTLPFIPYARVSKVGGRQGESFISVTEQTRKMRSLAKTQGFTLHDDVFEDTDRSGGTMQRPEFQRALDLVREGRAGGIVVATLDRFARDVEDALPIIRDIEAAGGRLVCGDGDITLGTGDGEFMATVRLAVGAFERSRKRDYMNTSRRNAIERGVHLAVPFGYERSAGKGSPLKPLAREARVVKLAFELRLAGDGWQVIAQKLNATGVLPSRGERFTHKTARGIVMNEVYTGVAYSGEYRNEHAHPAIVDRATFDQVQRTKGVTKAGPTDGYMLTGLVRCSGCGYAMVHVPAKGDRRYYICRTQQHASGSCPAPASVNADEAEAIAARTYVERLAAIRYEGAPDDSAVADAESVYLAAESAFKRVLSTLASLSDVDADERRIFDAELTARREALREAKRTRDEALKRALHIDLPDREAELTLDEFAAMPVTQQRHELSLLFACGIARKAATYRESVDDRLTFVDRSAAPLDSRDLIGFVVDNAD